MRIVYLLSYFELVGGQEYYLARQQARQGHEVFVVASSLFYPVPKIRERYAMDNLPLEVLDHQPGQIIYDQLTIIRLPVIFHYQDFIMVKGVKEVLERLRPDVVFGHEPRTMVPIWGAWYKKKFKYVFFLDSHDFFHRVQNHTWWQRCLRYVEYFWWRRFFVQYAYSQADRIISVADECKYFMHRHNHVPLKRIVDLPLGVDTEFFHFDQAARQKIRQELGWADNDIVLLFAGYMFRRKALESLIDLVAKARDLPLRLILAGEGPADYLEELKSLATEKGVIDRVAFTGFVGRRRVNEFYSASDIGVWPGNNSLVILEAMACGLPLVMADMQLAHLARHDNGFLIPYADEKAMEEKIRILATDPDLRKKMGQASQRVAFDQYSYQRLAQTVTNWMEESVDKKRD